MANPRPRVAGRRLQSRVVENDRRLLDAAVDALAASGWAGLTFQTVAGKAGLSRRTLQNRYPSTSALAAAVWQERCSEALRDSLEAVAEAAVVSSDELLQAFKQLLTPEPVLRAAMELLLLSQFDSSLQQAVSTTLGADIRALLAPSDEGASRVVGAQRAYLLNLGLGILLATQANDGTGVDFSHDVEPLFTALHEPSVPQSAPKEQASYLRDDPDFATGDPTLDALLQAMLEHVGTSGFDDSSVDRIAASAGFTTGALFARYSTKLELFLDATRRQQALTMPATQEFMMRMDDRYGVGIGMALNIRESQRPALAHLRAIGLEQVRVSIHNPELRTARQAEIEAFVAAHLSGDAGTNEVALRGRVFLGIALGIGIAVLPLLDPDCWSLPYDVVTVPLLQRTS